MSNIEASEIVDPIEGPVTNEPVAPGAVEVPRLARHEITLADGHLVGVTVAGEGVPLVVVHGFSAEGFLYAQSLSRLVGMGFRVVAIDTAGHGATQGLPLSGQSMNDYADLLGRCIDELGIERFVLAGHSMGGQLVARLAAQWPERTMAVILIDAIVGDTWDRMVYLFRVAPPLLGMVGALLALDSLTVAPAFSDPRQAYKLMRLAIPNVAGHVVQPWRLMGPMMSILRTRSSRYALDAMKEGDVPVIALHGNRDIAWQRLRSKLYDFEMRKRQEEAQKLEDTKTDVGWGHQIRSYVLDNSRIKDLRTNVEISATQKVLDGDLDAFIEASLKQGV